MQATEEISLIATYHNGAAIQAQRVSEERDSAISAQITRAKEAEEKILVSYFPLVRSIARKLYLKNKKYVEMDDLLAAGYEGLVFALRRYNPDVGVRFGTYARWWVRNRIGYLIRNERWTIKIPDSIYRQVLKLMRTARHLIQERGREPTALELAERMQVQVTKIDSLLVWANYSDASLDTPVGEDGTSTLADLIPEVQTPWSIAVMDEHEALTEEQLKEIISSILRSLTPLEEKVILARFGLESKDFWAYYGSELSIRETIELLFRGAESMTGERLRNIERRALRKLRHTSRSRKMRTFADAPPENL